MQRIWLSENAQLLVSPLFCVIISPSAIEQYQTHIWHSVNICWISEIICHQIKQSLFVLILKFQCYQVGSWFCHPLGLSVGESYKGGPSCWEWVILMTDTSLWHYCPPSELTPPSGNSLATQWCLWFLCFPNPFHFSIIGNCETLFFPIQFNSIKPALV